MKNLAMIACISSDGGLGKDNELLWHFKDDMNFFRETTRGATVVMGSKTFASINNKPLPKRRNIVLSRSEVAGDNIEVVHSEPKLRELLETINGPKYIIGGAALYKMFIDDAEQIFLTEVEAKKPADTYFPEFDKSNFVKKPLAEHEDAGTKYQIVEYLRKA